MGRASFEVEMEIPDHLGSRFLDGFVDSGLQWKGRNYNYVPGGPFCYEDSGSNNPKWKEYCHLTRRWHAAWMLGWWLGTGVIGREFERPSAANLTREECTEVITYVVRKQPPHLVYLLQHLPAHATYKASAPKGKASRDEIIAEIKRLAALL